MDQEDEKQNVPAMSTLFSSPGSVKLAATTDLSDESSEENLPVPGTLIGAENYLTLTEGKSCALSKDELAEAVTKCKQLILTSDVCSDERKWLVRRLIELRYQLLTVDEVQNTACAASTCWTDSVSEDTVSSRIVIGHHFKIRYEPTSTVKRYCDTCCGAIWNVFQSWYYCSDCRYRCHTKCIDQIIRPCAHLVASEKPEYETNICPEVGLSAQNYKCAECNLALSFKNSWLAPRLCDYSGLYYCTSCHWNNTAVIPARVSHNWDLKPYAVSRMAYQLLRFTRHRTLITLNPLLYGFVKELAEVKRLREELSFMKLYLVRCKEAETEKKLLWKTFSTRSHLLEPSDRFSLQDLTDMNSGSLTQLMKDIADKFVQHITKDCKICRGHGYRCEICISDDKDDVLFPFYSSTYVCTTCSSVYHKTCWLRFSTCRKCERNRRRKQESRQPLLES